MTSKDKYEPSEWMPDASPVAEKGFLDDHEVVGKLKLSHTQPSDASNKADPFVDLSAREMIEELRQEVRGGREDSRQEMQQFRQEQEQRLQDIRQQQDQMMRQMEVIAQLVSANRETGRPQESSESETLPEGNLQISIWTDRNAVPRIQDNVGPDSPLHLTTPTSPTKDATSKRAHRKNRKDRFGHSKRPRRMASKFTESGSRRSVSQRQDDGRLRQRPSPYQNKMKNRVLSEQEVSDLVNSRALTGVDMDEERLRQLEVEPLFTEDVNLLLRRACENADEGNEEPPAKSNREVHVRADSQNQISDLPHREEREDGRGDPCSDEVISEEQENENDDSRSDEVVQKRRHSI